MAKWIFNCVDNGGKHQAFTVTASDKQDAIKKALDRAAKKAAGDICGSWNVRLISA